MWKKQVEQQPQSLHSRTLLFLIFGLFFLLIVGQIIVSNKPIFIFAFVCSILYFIATIKYPEMALAGCLIVNFAGALQPLIGFGMTRVFLGGVILSSGCYIVRSNINRSFQIKMDSLQITNLVFSVWLLINLMAHTGLAEGYGLAKLESYLLYSFILFYAVTIYKNDLIRIERFVYFYVFGLAITTTISYVFLGNDPLVQEHLVNWGRFYLFGDPINYSLPFISGAVMAVYLYSKSKAWYYKIAVLLCMCEFVFILILSGTRQSIMATIFGVLLFVCLIIKQKRLIVAIIIFSASLWLFYSNLEEGLLQNRYSQVLDFSQQSIQQRLFHYEASFNTFLQFPLVGVGLGEYGRYNVPGMLSAHTHNLVLDILSEEGLIGFFLFVLLLWFPVRKAFYIIRKLGSSDSRFTLTCLFFSILVAELFRSNFSGGIGSRTILWFSIGALWVIAASKRPVARLSNKEDQSKKSSKRYSNGAADCKEKLK